VELDRQSDADSGETLSHILARLCPEPRDARLATALTFGVLRNRTLLDFQYSQFLKRPAEELSPAARTLLRLAAAQKHLLERIPGHAIANESVEAAKQLAGLRAPEVRFLNAIVRRIVAQDALREPLKGSVEERLAIRLSFPVWTVRLFFAKFGAEAAPALLDACNKEPAAALRPNLLKTSPARLAAQLHEAGMGTRPGRLAPGSLVLDPGAGMALALASDAFSSGSFYVQDEASQLVSLIARPLPGEEILDLCAAPGGKTTHLAELTGGKTRIVATDASNSRLATLQDNVARLGTPGIAVTAMKDIRAAADAHATSFHLVLVDAPCSGLGTVRRNPEIRYRCTTERVARLAAQQQGLLELAARLVAPGGRIVYSTCTVTDAENAENAARFLRCHPEFSPAREPHPEPAIERLRRGDGTFQTWPVHPESDGFEITVFKRHA
jgi:16S rRNA (cytosine967-C5)-methyltransferase